MPAILPILSPAAACAALPVHSEMEIFIYNKEMFAGGRARSGEPARDLGRAVRARARSSPTATAIRARCPGSATSAAAPTGSVYLNSTTAKLAERRPHRRSLFDNEEGLESFRALERGFKARFFDPNLDPTVDDYGTGQLFNGGGTASQINFAELWAQAVSGNVTDFGATIDPAVVGATILPGHHGRHERLDQRLRGLRDQQVQRAEGSGGQLHRSSTRASRSRRR